MKPLAIAVANLRRLFRDRSNLFFVFILPLALVLLIGLQFGGGFEPRLGVVEAAPGSQAETVASYLRGRGGVKVVSFIDEGALRGAVERGSVQAAMTFPADFDESLAQGASTTIGFIARQDGVGPALQPLVMEAVQASLAEVAAAQVAVRLGLAEMDTAIEVAHRLAPSIASVDVKATTLGEALFPSTLGRFDLGASSQLILFMFLTALTGGAVLIQTRQLGLSRRMLSTPTPVGSVVAGEALGRFAIVLMQGIYIMVGTLLIFGVSWGDPWGAVAVLVVFAAVGAGAAMLVGTVFRSAEQAGGIGVMAGLGLAALGGCMLPLQLFGPTLRRIAHVTPHAWAVDAFAELVQRRGTIIDILPQLGVLAAYASILLMLASWRLRRAISRG
jgi:ABC-2 type transport system permease protein